MSTKINAKCVGAAMHPNGAVIFSVEVTFPRFLLPEVLTHRKFSRNTSSSRAIPVSKMIDMVENDPFVPVVWQKPHKGMMGTEYYYDEFDAEHIARLEYWWRTSAAHAVTAARREQANLTKQLVNRILEPYSWVRMLITATDYRGFFDQRCPKYPATDPGSLKDHYYSWRDFAAFSGSDKITKRLADLAANSMSARLSLSESTAEPHMQLLAEAVWDEMSYAIERVQIRSLEAGQWYHPYWNRPELEGIAGTYEGAIVAAGMAAHTSYTVVGQEKELSPEESRAKFIRIAKEMMTANPWHASPFEHCALVSERYTENSALCRNFTRFNGNPSYFLQLRAMIEDKIEPTSVKAKRRA